MRGCSAIKALSVLQISNNNHPHPQAAVLSDLGLYIAITISQWDSNLP